MAFLDDQGQIKSIGSERIGFGLRNPGKPCPDCWFGSLHFPLRPLLWRRRRSSRRCPLLLLLWAIEDRVLGAAHDGHDLPDEFLVDLELFQRGLQVNGNDTEVGLGEFQIFVGLAHVLTGPGLRASQGGADEGLLLVMLALHVDVLEEVIHAVIRHDLLVEKVHGRADSGFASDFMIEAVRTRFLEFLATVIAAKRVGGAFVSRGAVCFGCLLADGAKGGLLLGFLGGADVGGQGNHTEGEGGSERFGDLVHGFVVCYR